jgi:hypothetical protein
MVSVQKPAPDGGAGDDSSGGVSSSGAGTSGPDASADVTPESQGGITADGEPVDVGVGSDAQPTASCYCTRRPDAPPSSQCPVGVGQFSQATIGPAGGTVTLQGRQGMVSGVPAKLDFPPMAIATTVDIKLTETNIPPPQEVLDWSPVYQVDPVGLALSVSTPIQLPWSGGPLGADGGLFTVPGLSIWFSPDGTTFTPISDSYTNAGFEQGSATQLGYFVVGAPRTAATASCP